jgi:hypothetical protein
MAMETPEQVAEGIVTRSFGTSDDGSSAVCMGGMYWSLPGLPTEEKVKEYSDEIRNRIAAAIRARDEKYAAVVEAATKADKFVRLISNLLPSRPTAPRGNIAAQDAMEIAGDIRAALAGVRP